MAASTEKRDNISTVILADLVRMRQRVRMVVYVKNLHYSFVTHEHRVRENERPLRCSLA